MPQTLQLFAPDVSPSAHSELRACTVAAFRVAQGSGQWALAGATPRIKIVW